MTAVAQQKPMSVAESLGLAAMHLEIGNPAQVAQGHVCADARVDRCPELHGGRRIDSLVIRVAANENKPTILRQRRKQDKARGADDDAGRFRWDADFKLDV